MKLAQLNSGSITKTSIADVDKIFKHEAERRIWGHSLNYILQERYHSFALLLKLFHRDASELSHGHTHTHTHTQGEGEGEREREREREREMNGTSVEVNR